DPDRPAPILDDPAYDREAEAGTGRVGGEVGFEDARAELGGYARSVVAYGEFHLIVDPARADRHVPLAVERGVRVLEEVQQDLLQLASAGADGRQIGL